MMRLTVATFCLLVAAASMAEASKCQTLSNAEKQEILDAHNILRAQTARGDTQGQPPACNMMLMEWDDRLEASAQNWVSQCVWKHDDKTDREILPRYPWVGQNMAYFSGKRNASRSVVLWFNEYKDYTYETQVCTPGKPCGHYTQLVWAKSVRVGCAVCSCSGSLRVVCNYAPGGNFNRQKPYQVGKPATCCMGEYQYNMGGLCASGRQCGGYDCKCGLTDASCLNGGTLDQASCSCSCPAGFYGETCQSSCRWGNCKTELYYDSNATNSQSIVPMVLGVGTPDETADQEVIEQAVNVTMQDITVAPEQDTTAAPEQETTAAPEQDTTAAPEQDITFAPEQNSSAAPEQDTTAAPEQDITFAPEQDITFAPEQDTTAAPEEDTTAAPEQDTTAAPVEETTAAPEEDTTAAPKEDTTAAPEEDTTAAPEEDTTAAPEEDTTAAPQQNSTQESEDTTASSVSPTFSAPSTTSSPNCNDKSPHCAKYRKYCDRWPLAKALCPRSCNSCQYASQCRDFYNRCSKHKCRCPTWRNICKVTCGTCKPTAESDEESNSMQQQAEDTTTASPRCFDKSRHCISYKRKQMCSRVEWVRALCPRSCNSCEEASQCRDFYNRCSKRRCTCPTWRRNICKVTCGTCKPRAETDEQSNSMQQQAQEQNDEKRTTEEPEQRTTEEPEERTTEEPEERTTEEPEERTTEEPEERTTEEPEETTTEEPEQTTTEEPENTTASSVSSTSSAPSTTSSPDCDDKSSRCKGYERFCGRVEWVMALCPRTCNSCKFASQCRDFYKRCSKQRCRCPTWRNICKVTCGTCQQSAETTQAPASTTVSSSCDDSPSWKRRCAMFKRRGLCARSIVVRMFCPRSCNWCEESRKCKDFLPRGCSPRMCSSATYSNLCKVTCGRCSNDTSAQSNSTTADNSNTTADSSVSGEVSRIIKGVSDCSDGTTSCQYYQSGSSRCKIPTIRLLCPVACKAEDACKKRRQCRDFTSSCASNAAQCNSSRPIKILCKKTCNLC